VVGDPVNSLPSDVTVGGFVAGATDVRVNVEGGGELEINSLRLFF
jgi:hypothetical protein